MKTSLLFCFFLCLNLGLYAQQDSLEIDLDIAAIVELDSFVVTAVKQGFSVEDFVQLVREDESFYKAFRNIRLRAYESTNAIELFNKKGKSKASYHSKIRQNWEDECRTMDVLDENVKGNFYKRKKAYRYYTAKLYDRLFFTHGRICERKQASVSAPSSSRMEKYVGELKKLIFQPGEYAEIPMIGKKTAIFSKKMLQYYDFSISSQRYDAEIDCYVFSAKVKPEYQTKQQNKTVIKELVTYFEKSNFQVVARNYQLKYSTIAYDFDVKMAIALKKIGADYLPEFIQYDGQWDIPAKSPEIAEFEIRFFY